ncbi:MAG: DUF4931 domain-containing protein [Patescibacteria group bacterium]|nr:DUF4931 domain-containing protein [Patescibacteria group bacterium]
MPQKKKQIKPALKYICDDITGECIILAPYRHKRPNGLKKKVVDPFSPKNLKKENILAQFGKGKGRVWAIENKYPVFPTSGEFSGFQEILVEGEGCKPFSSCDLNALETLLEAYASRALEMRRRKGVKYILIFKNDGLEAGASQPHAHSQIFALNFVPSRVKQIIRKRQTSARQSGQNMTQSALKEAKPALTIFSDKHVVAYADPASRFAYGARIILKRQIDNITETDPAERKSLAQAIYALLPLMKQLKCAYNIFFHDVVGEEDELFEINFTPRMNRWGGFELDGGIVVNPVAAETAAEEYRRAAC